MTIPIGERDPQRNAQWNQTRCRHYKIFPAIRQIVSHEMPQRREGLLTCAILALGSLLDSTYARKPFVKHLYPPIIGCRRRKPANRERAQRSNVLQREGSEARLTGYFLFASNKRVNKTEKEERISTKSIRKDIFSRNL